MNKKIALGALAFSIMLPAGVVFAEGETTSIKGAQRETNRQAMENQRETNKQNIQTLRQTQKLEFQDKKEKMVEEKCKNIETKIATRIGRYENNGKMLQNVYGNMQTRIARLVSRLDGTGADTTKLKTDLQLLSEKITKLYADQSAFMTTLKESQSFVCGKSEGEFKGKLEQARKVPELIKQDRDDIKNFFQTTIKADLQAIKATLPNEKETAEATETPKISKIESAPEVAPTPVQ